MNLDELILNDVDWKSELKDPPHTGDVKSPEDYTEDAWKYLTDATEKRGGRLPWQYAEWKFQPGHLNVYVGINGHGKSMMLSQMMAWLTRDGQSDRVEKVLFWSPEMTPAAQVARLVTMITGIGNPTKEYFEKAVRWMGDRIYIYQRAHRVGIDELKGISLFAQRRLGVTQIVIDSLVKIHTGTSAANQLLVQTDLADQLAVLARDSGLTINLVAHARKGERESDRLTKFDLKGSGAIADLADSIWIVSRNVRKNEMQKFAKGQPTELDDAPDGYLECVKNRHHHELPFISLWFNPGANQFTSKQGKILRIEEIDSE